MQPRAQNALQIELDQRVVALVRVLCIRRLLKYLVRVQGMHLVLAAVGFLIQQVALLAVAARPSSR